MNKFSFSWPQSLECERLPRQETGACNNGGIKITVTVFENLDLSYIMISD